MKATLHTRIVEPELLETLPEDHPDAIRARKDLLLVNRIMGNHRWIIHTLRRHCQPGWRITEIGAGDGALSRRLWQSGICHAGDLHAFDLARRPSTWPKEAAWTQGDIFHHPLPATEVLVANLFLHHFQDDALRVLGGRISPSTLLIIAAEPARWRIHTLLGRLLCGIARLHPVTRYDMQVSIRAGFRGGELPSARGLGAEWEVRTGCTALGAYHLAAWRRENPPDLAPNVFPC